MTERSVHEVTRDTADVTYEIKRARLSPSSPEHNVQDCLDSNKLHANGDCHNNINNNLNSNSIACNGTDSDDEVPALPNLPIVNPVLWVQQQIEHGINPISVLLNILPPTVVLPEGLSDITLWRIVIEILSDVPKRTKLPHINTLHDVITLLTSCRNIIIVSGAGISVSCGIPDFRSKDGIYTRLAVDYPDLPNPQAMFDIQYFSVNPKPFYKFASEIWPGKFTPSPSHEFIKLIEERGSLLRNYTQNIDTLERVCGIKNIIQCHGSFASATCCVCGYKVDSELIKDDVMKQNIPTCTKCPAPTPRSIMKPDIVFFGEGLPTEFHQAIEEDRTKADLVIVMGSSLKVKPVAHIPNLVPPDIPQLLINREPLPHMNFDVELLGDCDVIVSELCTKLGWPLAKRETSTSGAENMETTESLTCPRPARYLFPGAEVHEESSQPDSGSEEVESEAGVTTEDEEANTDNYVAQMRYVMGRDNRTFSENPGPSGLSQYGGLIPCPSDQGELMAPPLDQGEHPTPDHSPQISPCNTPTYMLRGYDRWETDSVSNVSVAAQMGDSREPSIDNVSEGGSVQEDMDANQT